MLDNLKRLFAQIGDDAGGRDLQTDELHAATAALLAHAASIDGHIAAAERGRIASLLERHFELSGEEAHGLLAEGEARERAAIDIYAFTRVLQEHLDQSQRQRVVELMWEVVAADGEVHPYESNLVWRAAELIGVSTRDRVTMRQAVFARHGISGGD